MRTCSQCKVEKDFSQFNRNKTRADGYAYRCKECLKKNRLKVKDKNINYQKEYRAKNIDKLKEYYESRKHPCEIPNCEKNVGINKKMCMRHSVIRAKNPSFSLNNIANYLSKKEHTNRGFIDWSNKLIIRYDKRCSVCNRKDAEPFNKVTLNSYESKKLKEEYGTLFCNVCRNKYIESKQKLCIYCLRDKPISDYRFRSDLATSSNGCTECEKERKKVYYEKSKPFCEVRKCKTKISPTSEKCRLHAAIAAHHPELTLEELFEFKSEKISGWDLQKWANAVKLRDDSACVECGSNQKLEAHHIKHKAEYPELALKLWNGITLCRNCHNEIHIDTKANKDLSV